MRASETQKFRWVVEAGTAAESRPTPTNRPASPEFIHIRQYLRSRGLRKPGGHAYIPAIPVILDGNRLRPAGRAKHKENLPWRPSP